MAKQMYRRRDDEGRFCGDTVCRADEVAEGEPLLIPYLSSGSLVSKLPTLDRIRLRCRQQLNSLPDRLHALSAAPDYPILYSDRLETDARRLMDR
jgi:nicotinate phosphoribosyltransferase